MRFSITLCLLVALATAVWSSAKAEDEPSESPQRIDALSLERGTAVVIGRLRTPLGTRQTIEGSAVEPYNHAKIPNSIRVMDSAIGHWAPGVDLEVRGLKLQRDKTYKLEGFESAEFAWPPEPNLKRDDKQPQLQFRTFFVATKVIEPAEEKRDLESGKAEHPKEAGEDNKKADASSGELRGAPG